LGYISSRIVVREALEKRVRAGLDVAHDEWLSRALERASRGTLDDLLRGYTDASRFLGRAPISTGADDASLEVPAHWSVEDAGRLLLLLTRHARSMPSQQFAADATACYEQGDTREQQSWMRGVALLPDAEHYLPLVIDACRTNILPLFEAIACENPYPARYFPERNFNQMVLKALFNNVALARIQGLADRANPELARMASDYAAERRAAGRSVPNDIGLAMTGGAARRTE
jgi:hypothetical protein